MERHGFVPFWLWFGLIVNIIFVFTENSLYEEFLGTSSMWIPIGCIINCIAYILITCCAFRKYLF
jgi:hypothetical protein